MNFAALITNRFIILLGIIGVTIIIIINYQSAFKSLSAFEFDLNRSIDFHLDFNNRVSMFYANLLAEPPSKSPYQLDKPNASYYSQFNQDRIMNEVICTKIMPEFKTSGTLYCCSSFSITERDKIKD